MIRSRFICPLHQTHRHTFSDGQIHEYLSMSCPLHQRWHFSQSWGFCPGCLTSLDSITFFAYIFSAQLRVITALCMHWAWCVFLYRKTPILMQCEPAISLQCLRLKPMTPDSRELHYCSHVILSWVLQSPVVGTVSRPPVWCQPLLFTSVVFI